MHKERNKALRDLVSGVLKIGFIGFGGGSALIPIIQRNLVEEKKLLTPDEYEEDVMIASVTPGALPVEISGSIGKRIAGWRGMLLGSVGMAFPGTFLTILLLSLMSYVNETVLHQIQYVAVGITAFISCVLTDYVKGTIQKADTRTGQWQNILIVSVVFLLTCGKNIFRIFRIEGKPVFSLSNIQIFGIAFLLLFLIQIVATFKTILQKKRNCADCVLQKKFYTGNMRQMRNELFALTMMLFVAGTFAYLVTNQTITYLWNGFLSSIMSFGGGDAYLTVAEGMFVETAMITEEEFYGQLVPLVNVLPGSILCKTLSGIGFYLGFHQTGNLLAAYMVAIAGFACSIFGSCSVVSIVGCFYKNFENVSIFRNIRRWIRPIVAGLMLNVILSLVYQTCQLGSIAVVTMIGIYICNTYLYQYKKVNSGIMVLLSVMIALIICNIGI